MEIIGSQCSEEVQMTKRQMERYPTTLTISRHLHQQEQLSPRKQLIANAGKDSGQRKCFFTHDGSENWWIHVEINMGYAYSRVLPDKSFS